MSIRSPHLRRQAQGSALVAALFLVIVVGALGVFAVRLQTNQQQGATLQLQEYRAVQAAHAGLEYWSYQVAHAGAACAPFPGTALEAWDFSSYSGFAGFRVNTTCTLINTGADSRVYVVTAEAVSGAFGTPDFVRRSATRHMQDLPPVYD